MKRLKSFVTWVLLIAAFAFVVSISYKQLAGEESQSPAQVVCANAVKDGLTCTIDPRKFDAQLISVDGGDGASVGIVISENGKIITVIPLQ